MAKKNKGNSSAQRQQAFAPEYHQILQTADHHNQPPLNPYYPNPAATLLPPASAPPPPYSSASGSSRAAISSGIPMAYVNDINYPRLQPQNNPSVMVQSNVIHDFRAERYKRKVRSFNNQTIIISALTILLALWAYNMYNQRNCIEQFVVHKLNPDIEFKISDVRRAHLFIAYGSGFIVFICFLKHAIGFEGGSHCCYLFIVALFSLFMCIHALYLTYLAYYSPCVTSLSEIASQTGKSFISKFVNSLPPPDKGVFGESNVVAMAPQDNYGFAIFVMDALNTIFYFSIFVSSVLLC